LFATAEGRRQLCDTANTQRLIVVHLGRDAAFSTLKAVQEELSPHILEFAPPDLPSGYKVSKIFVISNFVWLRLVFRIRIHMDPHSIVRLDPDPDPGGLQRNKMKKKAQLKDR
jgi:hypothetical protein